MPSKQQLRRHDTTVGISILALIAVGLVAGILLENWTAIDRWLPYVLIGVLIILFYRLVIAVEYLAYDA